MRGPGERDGDRGPGRAQGRQGREFDDGPSGPRGFADDPGRFDPGRGDDDLAADRFDRQRGPDFEADDDGPRSAPRFNRGARLVRFDDDDEDRD